MQRFALLLVCILLSFCSQQQRQPDEVRIRLEADPETLNPVSYNSSGGLQIINLLFQSLLGADMADAELKPFLAATMPVVTKQGSLTLFTYRIRQEARWTNGSPVTANDVAFSLKVLKAPLVNNEGLKPQVEFIKDIRLTTANNREITFVCSGYSPEMKLLTGDFFILPEYLFDPKGLLRQFSVKDLNTNAPELQQNKQLQEFATRFNSVDFAKNKDLLKGSGGYELDNWVSGQYITLKRKENWWAKTTETTIKHLTANPKRISFQIIPEHATALLALKSKQLDVLEGIPVAEFNQLKKDEKFKLDYELHTPDTYEFVYTGLNSRLPKFSDKRTRQAIAHLLDVDNLMAVTQENYATRTVGPVPPSVKEFYHTQLKPYTYSLQKAADLLKSAGWIKEQDGWYKQLNGVREKLTIEISYRAGNTIYENSCAIFQQSAAKAGIPVTIQAVEGALLSQKLREHDFEMAFRSLNGNPFIFNFKPLFHTSFAAKGNLNFTGFGTPESDKVLDLVNQASTTQEKAKHLKRLQEILHEEAAFVSHYYLKDRIAIHKRFANTKVSGLMPNYDVSAFMLKEQ